MADELSRPKSIDYAALIGSIKSVFELQIDTEQLSGCKIYLLIVVCLVKSILICSFAWDTEQVWVQIPPLHTHTSVIFAFHGYVAMQLWNSPSQKINVIGKMEQLKLT